MTKLTDNFQKYATQYRNKPEPQWPPPPSLCNDPHCRVCKEPVKNEPHGGFCGELACGVCDTFMMLKKPVTGRHYTTVITDDLVDEPPSPDLYTPQQLYKEWQRLQSNKKEAKMEMEGTTMTSDTVEARSLFEITTAYGEDRNDVKLITEYVVAESSSRAQLQKKPIPADWDMDYVTVIVKCLGTVRVKAKPREILATK